MTLNFIHLKKELFPPDSAEYKEALFRERNIECQVFEQRIFDYKIWEGIIDKQMPFRGINLAFKKIVQDAKDRKDRAVIIAEDDIFFSHKSSWQYYLNSIPEDSDCHFGCVYKSIINKDNKIEFGLSGMTLIYIHEKFFDTFLQLKELNNIDRELGRFAWKYKYTVCSPFVCHQHEGFSFHKGKNVEGYAELLEGRELYNG